MLDFDFVINPDIYPNVEKKLTLFSCHLQFNQGFMNLQSPTRNSVSCNSDCVSMGSMGSVEPIDFEIRVLEPMDFERLYYLNGVGTHGF